MVLENKVLYQMVNKAMSLFNISANVAVPTHSVENGIDSYVFYWDGFEFENRVTGACCIIPLDNGKECEMVCKKYYNNTEALTITKIVKIDYDA